MLPYLAQGANSAVEDGAVLGLLLGYMQSKAQLPEALRMYEKLRKSRGDALVKETFRQVSLFALAMVLKPPVSATAHKSTARVVSHARRT